MSHVFCSQRLVTSQQCEQHAKESHPTHDNPPARAYCETSPPHAGHAKHTQRTPSLFPFSTRTVRWVHHTGKDVITTPNAFPARPTAHRPNIPLHASSVDVKVPCNTLVVPVLLTPTAQLTFPSLAHAITDEVFTIHSLHCPFVVFPAHPRSAVTVPKRVVSCETPRPSWRNGTFRCVPPMWHLLSSACPGVFPLL